MRGQWGNSEGTVREQWGDSEGTVRGGGSCWLYSH